jgi:hypothetical protein
MGYQEDYNNALKRGLKRGVAKAIKRGSLTDISQEKPLTINQQLYGPIPLTRILYYAFEEGFEAGFEETYKKATHEKYINMAKNMLGDPKITIETVIEETGLERDEILKLKAELEG